MGMCRTRKKTKQKQNELVENEKENLKMFLTHDNRIWIKIAKMSFHEEIVCFVFFFFKFNKYRFIKLSEKLKWE